MIDLVDAGIGFLVGTATGTCGSYFAVKYTDKRKSKEHRNHQKKLFRELSNEHKKLLWEMKEDLINPKEKYQMDFYLGSKGGFGGSGNGYVYYYEEHEELENIVKMLQSKACVIKLSSGAKGNVAQYRFNEWFAEMLRNWKGDKGNKCH